MYQEILNQLKTKFVGISDEILGRIAKKLAETATTAVEVKTAVEGVTFQQVLQSYGDSRATDATKTAVANYEKKHNLKDGKSVEVKKEEVVDPKEEHNEDVPAWAKALMEGQKQLSESVKAMQSEKLTTSRKQKLDDVISKLPENMRKGYSRISVDRLSDEEFDTMMQDVTGEVAEIAKETGQRGAVFGKPTVSISTQQGDGVKAATEAEVNAVVNKLNL